MRLLTILFTVLIAACATFAQPLADRVPADAFLYLGWRGTVDPGAGYAGSRWASIAAESQFNKLIDETLPAITRAVTKRYPKAADGTKIAEGMVRAMVRYPVAIFVAPPVKSDGDPRVGILCRVPVGRERDAALAAMQSLAAMNDEKPTQVVQTGDDIGLLINYEPGQGSLAPQAPIAEAAAFKSALSQSGVEPTLLGYLNVPALLKAFEDDPEFATDTGGAKGAKLIEELGLRSATSLVYTAGFKGRDWQSDWSVETTGPRKGLFALAPQRAFSTDLLKRVPASATTVRAARIDAAAFVQEVKRVAAAVDPSWVQTIDQALGAGTMAVGKNIERDVLPPLGDEWILYNSPEVGGTSLLSTVLVSKVKDSFKAKQALQSMWLFASNTARTFTRDQPFTIGAQTVRVKDFDIYYFNTPGIAPCWAMKDGYLYAGLSPQMVAAAVQYAGPSIAENPKFVEAMKQINRPECVHFAYTDTAAVLPDGYATGVLISRSLLGMGDMFLAPTPEMVMPTLPVFAKQATPCATVSWADETGLHQRSHEPYPAAESLANLSLSNFYVSNLATTTSILLPSLNRAREAADRIKSSSNLRQIGLAAKMFANEQPRTNRMPNDHAEMLKTQDITIDVFLSPRTKTTLPPNIATMSKDEQGEWVNLNSDYVWLGKGFKDDAPADQPLAYEDPMKVTEGVSVLFFDGHVEWMTMPQFKQLLEQHNIKQALPE